MRSRLVPSILVLVPLLGAAIGCSDEGATPIDLGAGTGEPPTASVDGSAPTSEPPPTPHAVGENPQARAHAERQCREDAELAQGVIRIVDQASGSVVGEVVVDCAEVRAGVPDSTVPAPSEPSSSPS